MACSAQCKLILPIHADFNTNEDIKDTDGTSQESWANKASPEYVVKFLKENFPDVPEYLYKLIRTAPADGIIDWQLLWRDSQPNWTSPLGRVVQVGDSAHTFLPSSGNGAVQGIEDAISVATCLQLGGGVKNGLWSKTHNKLRQVQLFHLGHRPNV